MIDNTTITHIVLGIIIAAILFVGWLEVPM